MSLGLDIIGADYGQILSTVFQAAGGAVDYAKAAQDEKAAAAGADNALAQMIAADQAATSAVTKAKLSALTKSSTAQADQKAADAALTVQDTAGAALPEEKRGDRVKAAQEAVDSAAKRAQVATGSMKTVALVALSAAKQTLAKTKGKSGSGDGEQPAPASFFSRPIVWLGCALAAVAAVFAYKKLHK